MKKIIGIIIVVLFFLMPIEVHAYNLSEDTKESTQEELLGELDFSEMEAVLDELFPKEKLSFRSVLAGLLNGELEFSIDLLWKMMSDQLFYELGHCKNNIVHILIIAIIAAVFSNFSGLFQNRQVSDISFYALYLMLITVCLTTFKVILASVEVNLENLTTFMGALGPLFFMALALATGSLTSIGFYNGILLLIYLVELLVLNFLLPLTQLYIVVKILNHLSKEESLSKFAELLELIVSWTQKTLLAGVIGLNVIQGLLNPAIDSVKRSVITRGAEAMPVIGDALGGTAEVVLGTAVLIKNGIGMTGAIVCMVICLVPIVQIAVIAMMYKMTAAMIQPISDKRIVGCINSVAQGAQMLLKIVFTSGVLFLLTITIVAAASTS